MAWPKYKTPDEVFQLWKDGLMTKARIQGSYFDNLRLGRKRADFYLEVLEMIKKEEEVM